MPEVYDRCLGPALFAPFAVDLAGRVSERPGLRVLELAAGTGILTRELVAARPDADVTATDLNPAMVEWGAARVPGARWSVADAQQLGFADDSFDLVVCQFGAMFFPDRAAAYAEAARVLAPGGVLLLAVWDVVAGSDFTAALVDGLAEVLPDDPPSFIVRVPHGYSDQDEITRDLQLGGLEVRRIERVVLRGTASSARVLAEGFCLGTPLRFGLAERGDLAQLTVELGDQMERRLGSGAVEGDLTALVIEAGHG